MVIPNQFGQLSENRKHITICTIQKNHKDYVKQESNTEDNQRVNYK